MSQQKDIVKKSVKDIEEVVELFYQQKLQEALDQFQIVIGNPSAGQRKFSFLFRISRTNHQSMSGVSLGD